MIDRAVIIDLLQRVLDQLAGRLPAEARDETVGRVLIVRCILQDEMDDEADLPGPAAGGSLTGAIAAIRAAGGDGWDKIADVPASLDR
jgi:hypothetical protein